MDIDFSRSGVPELYSLLINGRSYEVLIEEQRQNYSVTLRGEQYHVRVEDERTRRLNEGRRGPELPKGDLVVKAPIPGMVVKVLVREGDEISEDQPLIILEAMKMENEIRALRAGVVRKVDVSSGQRVEQNASLLVIA
ncbi:MAG: acetyl-CoA carboxylase biotin carboxyl carrier protein subunit [Caldilineaceae bacterium]|nr:acetyl-CoA carboxylase biotin carboxyl carrier protein subunit [Caldilineaceae bacterium]